jgi:hypothetical protein
LRLTRPSCAPSATATALSESDYTHMACPEPPILISAFFFRYLLAVVSAAACCMPTPLGGQPGRGASMAVRHCKPRGYHRPVNIVKSRCPLFSHIALPRAAGPGRVRCGLVL